MTDTNPRAPWHLWVIGGLMLLWSVLTAFDYVMSLAQGEAYMRSSGMTDSQVLYFSTLPLWVTLAWTASVWGGVVGVLALLLRRKLAIAGFVASLAGTCGYILYTLILSGGKSAMGAMWFMPMVIGVLTVALTAYAYRLSAKGILRA